MARIIKKGIDYFPLDVTMDDKIELIEAKYGLIGFGLIIKIFQKIYKNGYYCDATEEHLLLLKKQVGIDYDTVIAIIQDGCKWGLFSQEHYDKYKILTSCGIQKRYIEITKRRKDVEFCKEYLIVKNVVSMYPNKMNVNIFSLNVDNQALNVDNQNQSKVKESKVKEKKEKLFTKFWDLYSKKVDTKKAKMKFLKLSQQDIDKIFKTLPWYIKQTPDKQYRKNPCTYLNNHSWNDEIDIPKIAKPQTKEEVEEEIRKAML